MTEAGGDLYGLRTWLFETALPLWWNVGADHVGGGFHEKIDLDAKPVALPHRARVIARQAYCYCEAGRLGWNGPWRDAALHALGYFRKYFVQNDATVVSVVGLDGATDDAGFDLYNQAFALLAYASAYRAFGRDGDWRNLAVALRATLLTCYAHPRGGMREDRAGRLPLRSNPHMHLFESALAWIAIDEDAQWRAMADNIAALCLERFIDPATGALREFFAADWSAAPDIAGQIVEPGHQYEWAFLLKRWAELTGGKAAAVPRLVAFADSRGLDPRRGVVVNAVRLDGRIHDPVARLWPQCERLRAYLTLGSTSDAAGLAHAADAVWRFLRPVVPGLWMDQMLDDGTFVVEPARATNLYHLLGPVAASASDSSGLPAGRSRFA